MKRLVLLFFIVLLLCVSASAQDPASRKVFATTVAGADTWVRQIGSGVQYHQLIWNVQGSVLSCQVQLDFSNDGVTSAGTIIATQLCTSNGSSSVSSATTANYVRINVTTKTGTGAVTVTYLGYTVQPGGGGGGTFTGSIAVGQVAVGAGADVIAGVANGSAGYALGTNGGNPATISWLNPATFMVYPGGGIPSSNGTGWSTSYSPQGTDSSVLTSGTVTGTGVALCTDANGGATTSGCPAGGITYPGAGIAKSTGTAWSVSLGQQGSDTNLLSSGTISGTATPLCTDASGGATTTGCPGPSGSVNTGFQYQISVYAADGTAISGGPTPPAVQGKYSCGYSPTTAAKVALTCPEVGLTTRAVTGTTSTDTILYSDNSQAVNYTGSVAVATTLPTATTLNNANFYTIIDNNTTGSPSNVTITSITWTVNSAATLVVKQGQECRLSVDPSSATNWLGQCGASLVSGQIPISQVGTAGLSGTSPVSISAAGAIACTTCTVTIANGTSALATGAITSGTCATVVTTTATGTATTDNIMADFNADPTSTTGYAPSSSGMLTIIKYPTSGNVNFKVCNNTTSSITPGAVTLNWRVVR